MPGGPRIVPVSVLCLLRGLALGADVSGPGERGRRCSAATQVCPGVLKCVQVCPGVLNVFRCAQCSHVCSDVLSVLRCVQVYSDVSRCVQVCSGVFRCVQVCPGVFRWGVTFSAPGDGDQPCSDSTSPRSPRGAWEHLSR